MKDEINAHLEPSQEKKRTVTHRKMILYLKSLTEDSTFMDKVFKIRKKYGLPKIGIKPTFERREDGETYEVPNFRPPEGFHEDLDTLANDYKIRDPFDSNLWDFVVYNDTDSEWYYDYREIVDLRSMLGEPESKVRMINIEDMRRYAKDYPVAILIDPYSSQRDIVNFIRTTFYSDIEPLQNKYRDPNLNIGRVRRKNSRVKERNDFIDKNSQSMGINKLTQAVNKKYGESLDYTYVRKILKDRRGK